MRSPHTRNQRFSDEKLLMIILRYQPYSRTACLAEISQSALQWLWLNAKVLLMLQTLTYIPTFRSCCFYLLVHIKNLYVGDGTVRAEFRISFTFLTTGALLANSPSTHDLNGTTREVVDWKWTHLSGPSINWDFCIGRTRQRRLRASIRWAKAAAHWVLY